MADKIGNYDVALELLLQFISERDLKSFILVFEKYQITVKGIRSCFYNSGPLVKQRRNQAFRLFKNICARMLAILRKQTIQEQAKAWTINEKTVENFFEGEYKSTEEAIEEENDELAMFS